MRVSLLILALIISLSYARKNDPFSIEDVSNDKSNLSEDNSVQFNNKIKLIKNEKIVSNDSPQSDVLWLNGVTNNKTDKIKYYSFSVSQSYPIKVDRLGNNIKYHIDPESDAMKQLKSYKRKRIATPILIGSTVAFAILSFTVGRDKTGEQESKYNHETMQFETVEESEINSAGRAFTFSALATGVAAMCTGVTASINLQNAVNLHNESVSAKENLSLNISYRGSF